MPLLNDIGKIARVTARVVRGTAKGVRATLEQLKRNLAVNPDLARRIEVVAGAIHASQGPVTLGARRKAGDSMSSTRPRAAGLCIRGTT